uniref:Uncharacterized protein n=1 Tax=Arundo donax TaxID=35708 RepID=A0A0A9DJ29_ARUDO
MVRWVAMPRPWKYWSLCKNQVLSPMRSLTVTCLLLVLRRVMFRLLAQCLTRYQGQV